MLGNAFNEFARYFTGLSSLADDNPLLQRPVPRFLVHSALHSSLAHSPAESIFVSTVAILSERRIIRRSSSSMMPSAFAGGLDIAEHRWDTPDHLPQDPHRVDSLGRLYPPYHDVQLMVDSDAAAALGDLVRERWRRATGKRLRVNGGRAGRSVAVGE